MLRRLLFLFLAVLGIFWWLRRLFAAGRRPPGQAGSAPAPPAGGEMVRDRVCNTFLPRARALTVQVGSQQEYFCSEKCKQTFVERSRTPA